MTHDETAFQDATPPGVIRVRDSARILEFSGEMLAEVSTENPTLPRWTEMRLYKVTDGTNRYVLSIIGRSVVYHVTNGICNAGVPVTAEKLPGDAEPCRRCTPPRSDALDDDVQIDLEEDRYTVHVVDGPDAVVSKLRNPRTATETRLGAISGPGQRLLAIAAAADPGMYNAVMVVDRL